MTLLTYSETGEDHLKNMEVAVSPLKQDALYVSKS